MCRLLCIVALFAGAVLAIPADTEAKGVARGRVGVGRANFARANLNRGFINNGFNRRFGLNRGLYGAALARNRLAFGGFNQFAFAQPVIVQQPVLAQAYGLQSFGVQQVLAVDAGCAVGGCGLGVGIGQAILGNVVNRAIFGGFNRGVRGRR